MLGRRGDLSEELFEGRVIRFGSSPESMGEGGLREMAKSMVEGDFGGLEGPKAVRLFGCEFQFVVQALDDAGGYGATSTEPVEQELAVTA